MLKYSFQEAAYSLSPTILLASSTMYVLNKFLKKKFDEFSDLIIILIPP